MDPSTEHVSIFALFFGDILREYPVDKHPDLQAIIDPLDLREPYNRVPIKAYNDLIDAIEQKEGSLHLLRLGRRIGNSVYNGMLRFGFLEPPCSPVKMAYALQKAAQKMVQDPKKRGFDILEEGEQELVLRRTQTFNGRLQFGVIESLMEKTTGYFPSVEYIKSVESGDPFDEYKVSWS